MIPFRSTSWDVRHSMDKVTFFLPSLLDGSFPGVNSGRLCEVLHRLDRVCLAPDLSLLELPFEGRGLRCWIFSTSPFDCSIGYLLLVLGHPLGSLISDFIQEIQVLLQLVVVALLVKELPPKAGESYFDRDDCFCAIGQVEWCLSRGCSCRRPVCP